jgi:hypothetical protein
VELNGSALASWGAGFEGMWVEFGVGAKCAAKARAAAKFFGNIPGATVEVIAANEERCHGWIAIARL